MCINAGKHKAKVASLDEARTDHTRKAILIAECGVRCQRCGHEEWQGEAIPLELDHVDGDSDNNARENLRLLCCNCHALTPTHRGCNRGNGGSRQRRKNARYAAGLTY